MSYRFYVNKTQSLKNKILYVQLWLAKKMLSSQIVT